MSKKELEVKEEKVEEVEPHHMNLKFFLIILVLMIVVIIVSLIFNKDDKETVDNNKTTTTTTTTVKLTNITNKTTATKEDKTTNTTNKPTTVLYTDKYESTYNLSNDMKITAINLVLNKNGVSTPELRINLDDKEIYREETHMVVISKKDVYSINDTDFLIGLIDESDAYSKDYLLFYGKNNKYKSFKDIIKLPVLKSIKYDNDKFTVVSDRGKIELDMECQEAEEDRVYEVTQEFTYDGNGKLSNAKVIEQKTLLDFIKEEGANSCREYLKVV